jgi:hypothetical protein
VAGHAQDRLPQLIRIALPGLGNLWMILLKDTALISAIGLTDILRQTGVAARVTKEAFLFYGIAFLLFLVLALLSSVVFSGSKGPQARGRKPMSIVDRIRSRRSRRRPPGLSLDRARMSGNVLMAVLDRRRHRAVSGI